MKWGKSISKVPFFWKTKFFCFQILVLLHHFKHITSIFCNLLIYNLLFWRFLKEVVKKHVFYVNNLEKTKRFHLILSLYARNNHLEITQPFIHNKNSPQQGIQNRVKSRNLGKITRFSNRVKPRTVLIESVLSGDFLSLDLAFMTGKGQNLVLNFWLSPWIPYLCSFNFFLQKSNLSFLFQTSQNFLHKIKWK